MLLRSNQNGSQPRFRWAALTLAAAVGCHGAAGSDGEDPGEGTDTSYLDAGGHAPPPPPLPPGSGGDFGATPGGVQDMGMARELIAEGRVPPSEAFVVEGMFSEHDLPVDGPPCDTTLCLRGALAVAPTLDGDPAAWVQVGMSSTIDPETFERPSLTAIATVDVSGSMGWEYREGDGTPGEVSRELLHALAAELDGDDRIAIVTYGSDVQTPLELTRGDDIDAIAGAIDELSSSGVTDMESGLRRAYQIAEEAEGVTDEVRVLLFTDIQPNVGATTPTEFETIVSDGSAAGVGITVFGVGLGLRQELLNAMSHLRGGNAFSLFDVDDVDELMADDWPWLASPIAYDFSLEARVGDELAIAEGYGFPAGDDADAAGFDVSTIFLSRRRGALLLRLAPDTGDGELPDEVNVLTELAYTETDGTDRAEELRTARDKEDFDEGEAFYEQPGVAKAVALAILVSALREAAELYADDADAAIELARAARDRIEADAEALDDDALDPEVELATELVILMEDGAAQGDFYPYP